MNSKAKVLLKVVPGLTEQERTEIATAFWESLEPPHDPEVDRACREKAARRVAEL